MSKYFYKNMREYTDLHIISFYVLKAIQKIY